MLMKLDRKGETWLYKTRRKARYLPDVTHRVTPDTDRFFSVFIPRVMINPFLKTTKEPVRNQ